MFPLPPPCSFSPFLAPPPLLLPLPYLPLLTLTCLLQLSCSSFPSLLNVPLSCSSSPFLASCRDLTNVFAITTAKVPIVKFTFTQGRSPGAKRIDGDISLYNTLALHNTRMLALYSELNSRVKTLGR